MLHDPADTPVTTPEVEPMDATDGLLLLHTPPPGLQLAVDEDPTQSPAVVVSMIMGPGFGFTVTDW